MVLTENENLNIYHLGNAIVLICRIRILIKENNPDGKDNISFLFRK